MESGRRDGFGYGEDILLNVDGRAQDDEVVRDDPEYWARVYSNDCSTIRESDLGLRLAAFEEKVKNANTIVNTPCASSTGQGTETPQE